ncbi:hypothetical protein G1H11_14150 [Phytoactinopolyspora alkaliphila]|uniref:HK97 gp10 family phage protein n=1 Tax=Phytoactinopolyspora alkaliphila TaxID=1783498 RepID=A0A6N9YNN5_9ACTN|nr:hypothetical protein [Phytoactinopolyspora alkaliphila]NED96448.1 hypothetical protein [Phytoactinopolyspora alkaliphila]
MSEFDQLSNDLSRAAATLPLRARGAGAKAIDQIASNAQQAALGSWTRYGRGMRGAAGTIRGRMSRDRSRVAGYVMGDDAALLQEYGTSHHPPQPVIGPAVDAGAGSWAEQILDAGGDLLR